MTNKPLDCTAPTVDEIRDAHKLITSGRLNKIPTGDCAPVPISAPRSPDTVCLSREVVDYIIDRLLEIVLGRNKAGQVVDFPADIANETLTKIHAEMGE